MLSHPTTTHITAATIEPAALPDWLPPDEWPFPTKRVRAEDTVTFVDVGSGPSLLLVHVGMWSFLWRDLVLDLSKDHRCVVVEAPTSGLDDRRGPIGITDAADAVTTVVEALALDDTTLVAHDLGGTAALHAAADWPERIRSVVAVNTFGWRPEGAMFRTMLALMGSRPMQALDVLTGWLPRMTSTGFGVGRHMDRATRRCFRRGMDRRGRRSFHRYMRSVRKLDYGRVDRAVAALADRPLLTIFGERNDPLGFQPEWAERFDDIAQVEIPRGNHFPMCDDPGTVAAAIREQVRRTGRLR